MGYFQNIGQQPPPAIFDNGEREGAFKVGDGWMDVIDLLMAVMKAGGIMNVGAFIESFSIALIILSTGDATASRQSHMAQSFSSQEHPHDSPLPHPCSQTPQFRS